MLIYRDKAYSIRDNPETQSLHVVYTDFKKKISLPYPKNPDGKLKPFALPGNLLKLFHSYLKGRKGKIRIGFEKSN